ncbi:acyltransferase [Paraburkholderia sp. UYCP14C]|uniref:acyltransferase family protein n=1 Tax=Paraburkholderia sp. UYCP14C TaxID=2511130 RepID=UPI0027D320F4|nr:acyltransferase [Paraburkholderia sp. UYCP14C]
MVSGFIMSYITAGKELHVPSFMVRRAVRILPMYWLFTTVALCALIVVPKLAFTHTELPPGIVNSYLLIPDPHHSLLLMVGWTLSYELLFYLVFALAARMPGRPIAVVLAILWSSSFFAPQNFYMQFIFNDFWAEFLVGTILFRIVDKKASLFAVGGIALIVFLILAYYGLPDRRSVYFGLPAVTVVSIVIGLEGFFKKYRTAYIVPALKFLGDASYSIYLSHFFSLNFAYLAIYKVLKLSGRSAGVAYFGLAIALSLIAGGLVHVLIEKKILRALKNMGGRDVKGYVNNQADTGAA